MRRNNIMYNKINRNNDTGFLDCAEYNLLTDINQTSSHISTITPDIFVNQFGIDEPDLHNGVKIIEISSTNNSTSSIEEPPEHNRCHDWSYVDDDAFEALEETFRINTKAREKRRLNNQNEFTMNSVRCEEKRESSNGYHMDTNKSYWDECFNKDVKTNPQTNCFTIINKHFLSSETSSEDDRADLEMLGACQFPTRLDWSENEFADEIIAYTDTDDIEKRTVWIYSFKNKHLLTGNDFELLNISAQDTISSSCTEELDEPVKDTNVVRVGSPIPPAYIPRLNLCPTLSTVTEITEPVKAALSDDTTSTVDESPKQKINSWLPKKDFNVEKDLDKHEKTTNIINWMALSPRERRRCLSAHSDGVIQGRIKTLQGLCSSTKNKCIAYNKNIEVKNFTDAQVQTNIEVHVVNRIPDVHSIHLTSIENNSIGINMNTDDIQLASVGDIVEEGDRYERSNRIKYRPRINISLKEFNKKDITDPIENLNTSNWISEESIEKQTAVFDYELDEVVRNDHDNDVNIRANSVSDRLWARNASLLKPAKWTEFLPITDTVPSINLSPSSDSYIEKSCIRRFCQLFRCCK